MSYNRCKDIHKFGNKYLPSAYKTQVEFRSHFSGKSASYGVGEKVHLMVREIRYIQADFFRDTTIWDFAINLTMTKIKNISNVLQLMNE